MNLELLANETILDLFEYIPLFDLFHGFFNLNSRFNQLLCVQFRNFHLDLRLLSKTKCEFIYENYVPLVINRIISLYLSNDDHTPQMIELFLSQRFQLRQLTHLQSITISFNQSKEILDQIMIECYHLPCLTRLSFPDIDLRMSRGDADHFYNQIWSLKHLTYCLLNIWFDYKDYFPNPTVISTSLRHLIIKNVMCSLSRLRHLCHHTPNLEYLSIRFEDLSHQFNSISLIQSIIRLNIDFTGSIDILKELLRNLPNLSHLKCEVGFINGYQWEEIIRQCLSKLEVFQFKTYSSPWNNQDKKNRSNEIIDTYRTKFWIEEHQWFVRGDWCDSDGNQSAFNPIYLFTLPYIFREFFRNTNCILSKSTSPFNEECLVCDNVKYLDYDSSSFMCPILSRVRFCYIKHLSLLLPFNDQFLSVVSKLDRLVSLYITVRKYEDVDKIKLQLQLLLNQALHLRSLDFGSWLPPSSPVLPTEITSVSVRQLYLLVYIFDTGWLCYDDDECAQLCRSSLGKQCETLSIKVKNRRNILDLMNNMPRLQSMHVRCDDDTWSEEDQEISSTQDELVEWLRYCLPSSCLITRHTYHKKDIRLWIR